MTLVVDASVLVAGLVDTGELGAWAEGCLAEDRLAAPHLMPVEAMNILRRAELAADMSPDAAALAVADLSELPVDLYPFDPFADRVWQLRQTVTAYDAWYVALAESLDADLVTIDKRLASAPGPECEFRTPAR